MNIENDGGFRKTVMAVIVALAITGIGAAVNSSVNVNARLAAIETRVQMREVSAVSERGEINSRLDRIESKIDKINDRRTDRGEQ